MTAPTRRKDAAVPTFPGHDPSSADLWRKATGIRQEWLDHGLSTQPADRSAAERSLTAIYARLLRPQPRFAWVDSPAEALPLIAGLPTLDALHDWIREPRPPGTPPLASDLAMTSAQLRGALSAGVSHTDPELSAVRRGKTREPWPDLPPLDALRLGVPLGVTLHRAVRGALHRTLVHGFALPVRSALADAGPVPVCWYGQQDASWVAYYDVLHRLGLARYGPDERDHLADWATLVRSCGWWWPGEDVCVVVERPETVSTAPVPGARHDEVRLQQRGVRYRDGWHPRIT
ncbi:DUF6745 domain-containing protein [Krasilnikovia sp. MM14-A1259]|uniref:DUF6745 domain-containing protein n=1 Tax=Krasilnikovia sp. MM14-A1259 TaxID=3373539 RepID=UPI0038070F38